MAEKPTNNDATLSTPGVSASDNVTDALLKARAVDSPPRPGLLAALDRFEILQVIGQGGMGVVLLARDPATDARVAIKMLRPDLAREPQIVKRFLTEAKHMYKLDHGSILRVLEVSDRAAGPYYVMLYKERGSLAKLIQTGQPLEQATTFNVARQVATALAYAHTQGLIHRDVKPHNVLLDPDGRAHLADFGLVRTVYNDSLVEPGHEGRMGTVAYMSPAVARGDAEDTRCDIYSFGAVLYEMLTGEPPYMGTTREAIFNAILAGPPTAVRTRNPQAPSGLVAVCEGCMARELRDRYATMDDVVRDLDLIADQKLPLGPHRAAKATRGRRGRYLSLVGAGALAAIAALLAWHFWPQGRGIAPSPATGSGTSGSPQVAPLRVESIEGLMVTIHGLVTPPSSFHGHDSFQWDWGDGTQTDQNFPARHAYARPGRYTVRLTVTDPTGKSTAREIVVALPSSSPATSPTAAEAAGREKTLREQTIDRAAQLPGAEGVSILRNIARQEDLATFEQVYLLDAVLAKLPNDQAADVLAILARNPVLASDVRTNFMTRLPELKSEERQRVVEALAPSVTELKATAIDGLTVTMHAWVRPAPGSTGDISYLWNWGDGVQEQQFFPARHRYARPGEYQVHFSATDRDGLSTTREAMVSIPSPATQPGPNQPQAFTLDLGGGVTMKFVRIEAGEFVMGAKPSEFDLAEKSEPQHRVRISRPFMLGIHEVTRGQFGVFVSDTGYRTDAEKRGHVYGEPTIDGSSWSNPGFPQTDEHPVVGVSWMDAVAFCDWLSRKEQATYRLPTEAEWEYACRAGTTTTYPWGDNPQDGQGWGNFADLDYLAVKPKQVVSNWSDGYAYTAPVGTFRPNDWGLYDMLGNAGELCSDWLGDYPRESVVDPHGPSSGDRHIVRGPGYHLPASQCRPAARFWHTPTLANQYDGFRVVREIGDANSAVTQPAARDAPEVRRAKEAAARYPTDPQAWTHLANMLRRAGDLDRAIQAARRATEIAPRDADTWACLAWCAADMNIQYEALQAGNKAVELAPESPRSWTGLGYARESAGRYSDAAEAFRKVIEYKPDDVFAWQELSLALSRGGEPEPGIAAAQRGIALAPKDAGLWFALGLAQYRLKRYDESIESLEQALALMPDFQQAREALDEARREVSTNSHAAQPSTQPEVGADAPATQPASAPVGSRP